MYNIYYIKSDQLNTLFNELKKKYKVFSAVVKEQNFTEETDYSYKDLPEGEPLVFNPYRAVEPLKAFFTHTQDKAAEYFNQDESVLDLPQTIIFGVKSCDIAGHKVQDFVFLEGVEVDSLYRLRRESTILVSSDCTDFKEVCHCLAWEILPHPTAGFDLNLSPLNDGCLVEVGSKKGEDLIQQYKEYFVIAKDSQLTARKVKGKILLNGSKSIFYRNIWFLKILSKD